MDKAHARLSEVMDLVNEKLIVPEFLMNIERWARYKGEQFYIGDMDVRLTDLGTFTKIRKPISMGLGKENEEVADFINSFGKKGVVYDVSMIEDMATMADNNTLIVMAEVKDYEDELYPPILHAYSIDTSEDADNSEYTKRPSLDRLKDDFESGKRTWSYTSLINCSGLMGCKLQGYSEYSDRLADCGLLSMDLELLTNLAEEKIGYDPMTIKVSPRKKNTI